MSFDNSDNDFNEEFQMNAANNQILDDDTVSKIMPNDNDNNQI